ncbi:methyltransferase domain-containing protein [candidate division WOR-3 bacterium]|nr:methyltransferase domain-containing protein [candidate division WOR-3 bacterium]
MKRRHPIDYSRVKTRREVLIRQRRDLWTPEQVGSLARHFRLKPGMGLLDAGCGFGYALRTWGRFCMPGGKLVGLDRDRKLLAQAARFCTKEGLGKAARFATGEICSMPFENNTFDMTLAHVVFCHLAEPEKALDEMIRVTRSGGCVAVFDNAMTGSPGSRWNNWHQPTTAERLLMYEVGLRMTDGRRKVGFGDWSVGCHVPAWMEGRGLIDVGVRTNERVVWIAPPYRSPGQRTAYTNTREHMREPVRWDRVSKSESDQMRAGGLARSKFDRCRRRNRLEHRAFRKAMKRRTAAYAWSSPFWCIWGFKP